MRYEEFPPPASLARWVRCAWVFEADSAHEAPERIVPDGRPELVVHWKAPFAELDENQRGTLQPGGHPVLDDRVGAGARVRRRRVGADLDSEARA